MLPARKSLGAFLFGWGLVLVVVGMYFESVLLLMLLLGLPLMILGGMICAKGFLDL